MLDSRCAEHFCEFGVTDRLSIFYRIGTAYYDCLPEWGEEKLIVYEFVLN